MSVLSKLRSAVPPVLRVRLRKNRVVEAALLACVGREQSRRHPHAPYHLHFGGRRNLGWALGGLAESEREYVGFSDALLKRLRPTTARDVGANVGFWSLHLAGFEPKINRMIAFEPDETNLRLLRRNKERNRLATLELRAVALSDRQGTATFHADAVTGSTGSLEASHTFIAKHFGRETTAVQVPLTTADAVIAEGTAAPQFLKIDVEGHELSLLRGAERLLRERLPTLLLEIADGDGAGTVALLKGHGYRLFDPVCSREVDGGAFEVAPLPAERVAELLP